MSETNPADIYMGRITEDYLIWQINAARKNVNWSNHKKALRDFDTLYAGDLSALFPADVTIPAIPLVENKLKNATHDLARLASDAAGTPVFMRQGESQKASTEAALRASITDTLWEMGEGRSFERKLYIDLIAAGMAAVSVFYNDTSDYPIYMRLDPRSCYPDVRNGKLQSMVYIENMKERQAGFQWPELGLDTKPNNNRECMVTMYMDDKESVQCVATLNKEGNVGKVGVVSRWVHELGCVPVAFKALDSADASFHGLFDQLGGPLMIRNKIINLMTQYLEEMVHAPFEERGIINATDEPGPLRVYHHDTTIPDGATFIRRVAPASPSGGVFGLLSQMGSEESAEAIQPPARVGIVNQSIASGSFVASTQGTLSSVIKELQDTVADLRVKIDYVAYKVDAKYLNREKPLWRAVGNKQTYKPKDDMGEWYHHKITYGAAAGLNRGEADVRILQHLGAKLIDHETARSQLDYIDDATVIQNRIDRENLADVMFQRFVTDPLTPVTALADAYTAMGKGKTLVEVVEQIIPQLQAEAAKAQQAAAGQQPSGPAGTPGPEAAPQGPGAEQASLEAGGGGPGQTPAPVEFAPGPLNQNIIRNPF